MPNKPIESRSCHSRAAIFAVVPGLEIAERLFDTIGDILFCVKDRESRYIAANEAFIHRAGRTSREALLGRTAREIFPAILAAGYEQQDQEVFSKGTAVRDRLEMITQEDGDVGWFVSQKIAVKSAAGVVIALAGISRDLKTPAAQGRELGALADAINTLHLDSTKPLRIESLAKKSGFSLSQFERRVRSITGLSPRQLLTKSRIEASADVLRNTEKSLATIAHECGFYDQAAFSRQFRLVTGLTPSEYRRAFRG